MGAGGSLPNNFKCQEPPPLPPPFYTGNPQSGISRVSSSESSGDRRASGTSTVTLGNPGFQDPRFSASLKNEEWWHRRPSAPILSSLRPQQETVLTYAAQMTGWQSGCGSGTLPSMHQEATELTRTVSHLAAANQQLASTHSTLLAQLEALYLELNRERELRIESSRNAIARKRPSSSNSDEDDDKFKLANRLGKLEAAIAERQNRDGSREKNSWLGHERELRFSLEELEDRLASRKDAREQSDICDKELELRLGSSTIVAEERIASMPAPHAIKRRNYGLESGRRLPTEGNEPPRAPKIGESDDREANDNAEEKLRDYQKAIDRIKLLENELRHSCGRDVKWESVACREMVARDRGKIDDDNRANDEDDAIDWSSRSDSKSSEKVEETRALLGEIERLKDDRSEYREMSEKLTDDLENQKRSIETLRRECENSRMQCEKAECRSTERMKQIVALTEEFEAAKFETSRLVRELQVFTTERDTATARIADLEKDFAKSTLDKEQIVIIENQESARLRKKLSEEMASKMEQTKALDSALKEIRRLNEIIEAARREAKPNGVEEMPEVESNPEEKVLDPEISVPRSCNMDEFRQELSMKREARQRAIAAVSLEMDRLRRELDAEKEAHSETSRVLDLLKSAQATDVAVKSEATGNTDDSVNAKEDVVREDWRAKLRTDPEQNSNEADAQALTDILKVSDELRSSIRLQTEKIDDLRFHLECEPDGHRNRIATLKGIAEASREASSNRERQINKLKNTLAEIIAHLGDARFRIEITDDVRSEHDRQIEDIRRLRGLYDERLRVLVDLRDVTFKELTDVKDKLKGSQKENGGLEEDLRKAEEKIDNQDTEISNLESQLGLTKADCRDLQNQMSVINGLFTQMLLSASSADMDLDRLTRLLQENHDLISDMAREEGTEAAALPKLLLDIVEQVEGRGGSKSADGEIEKKEDCPQEENIAHNLPKVWRVLLELLSCHAVGSPAVTPASLSTDPNSCYKSVDTPSGPILVISVSKTYIRLKELILEKKHLEKEMNRMKQLNTHLESKLGEQEKRLSTVSSELSKTWNVVGRMQAQHQQLHTHEKILRYELQQKRKMLQELKQELEYCREKWESARQKNTNTEIEWRSLRREFAARKSLAAQDSFNNSGESGFSDERGDDSDEEDDAVGERVRIGPRRRARKENPRAQTPDTESEQPTDTELSESKTGSISTPEEQRTPTPETAIPTEDVSTQSTSDDPTDNSLNERRERAKPMNPLDQALANVIQNLIATDEASAIQPTVALGGPQAHNSCTVLPFTSSTLPEVREEPVLLENFEEKPSAETCSTSANDTKAAGPVSTSGVSIFSIGPFPISTTPPQPKTVQFSDPLIVGPSTQTLALPVFGDLVRESEDSTSTTKVEEVDEVEEVEDADEIIAEKCSKIGEEKKEEKEKEEKTVKKQEKEEEEEVTKPVESCSSGSQELTMPDRFANEIALPSTSTAEPFPKPVRTHEEVLAARAARLRRLEEQADWLMKKMNATSIRGSALNTRLEELHEVYGEAPVPPPMPDVLPNVRIPSDTETQQAKKSSVEKDSNETPPHDFP